MPWPSRACPLSPKQSERTVSKINLKNADRVARCPDAPAHAAGVTRAARSRPDDLSCQSFDLAMQMARCASSTA